MDQVQASNPTDSFSTFGDLLKYLRRRARLTQLELSIAVGYSEGQISRLEQNQRLPDIAALKALFIPSLDLEEAPELAARLLELAQSARQEDAPAPGLSPYKGLLFFDESDAGLFFGREALTERLTERVKDLALDASTRFLALVGASGSGKSSLVRAGLATALRRAGWDVCVFTPTASPLQILDMNLSPDRTNDAGRTLILVDQFEELFTLCHYELERIGFIERLLYAAGDKSRKATVVIALRADFYSHCAQYPELREAVAGEQIYIGQMTLEELRCAIEEPAKQGGWELEPGLVEVLLSDLAIHGSNELEPGALPLLSHALLATWQRRRGRTMTLDGYRASGGIRRAIAETAESVFTDQLNQAQQDLAQDVFLRLTELGEGTEDTRRRAALNELVRQNAEAYQVRSVLNTLAEARLITLNEDSAEVAHEALIREWDRLHEWLTQDRESLLLHRHITASTHEWEGRSHDPAELYRGARLAQAREWSAAHGERLSSAEQAFLAASIVQEEHEAIEREAQRQRELLAAQKLAETQSQAAKQLKQRALFLAGAFSLAVALSVIALFFWKAASQNELKAQSREVAAAALNNLGGDPERSILLSLQALKISDTVEAENALHRSLLDSRLRFVLPHDAEVWSVTFSPDGKRIGTASQDKTAKIWDADTGKLLLTLRGHTDSVNGIVFSPDGKRIATTSDDHTAKVWDAVTGKELLTFSGHTSYAVRVAFSLDGKRLVTTSYDHTIKIWDAATGQEFLTITRDGEAFFDVAFSPDGKRLATSSQNFNTNESNVMIWDATTGKELLKLPINGGSSRGVAFSPDGTRIAATGVGMPNGTVWDARCADWGQGSCRVNGAAPPNGMVWDAATGKVLWKGLPNAQFGLLDIAFSPDGTLVANAGFEQKARVWNLTTGQIVYTLSGHTGPISGVAFSPDGTRFATASWDHTVRVWDLTPGRETLFIPVPAHGSDLMISSPDGSQIMSPDLDNNSMIVLDGSSGKELFTLKSTVGKIVGAIYSPDGKRVATASDNGQFQIWDSKTGKQAASLSGIAKTSTAEVFSADGSQLVSGYVDGEIVLWDLEKGKVIQTLQGPNPDMNSSPQISSLVFNPDGTRLLSGDINGVVTLRDLKTGKQVMSVKEQGIDDLNSSGIQGLAFSPDGQYVAVATEREVATVFDASTGKQVLTLKGHTGGIWSIRFSPDGKYIATTSIDGTTRLWDAATGKNLLILPIGGVNVSFRDGGKQLVVSNQAGVYGFVLPIEDLIALAKSRLTRTLTTDECQQYLHVQSCPPQ